MGECQAMGAWGPWISGAEKDFEERKKVLYAFKHQLLDSN
ncbi:hypothetical protein SAMN05216378_4404 [Paenibacillus catalpae]|uniref:Uncharacterized protein n=1 Tax=Paenibacillus catalpae TaxID=1045775 RepID=A0A1I2E4M9_9BACL|nr:hypothetical protein SAMN05216378_4404 [Paenibacillus catalpae]